MEMHIFSTMKIGRMSENTKLYDTWDGMEKKKHYI